MDAHTPIQALEEAMSTEESEVDPQRPHKRPRGRRPTYLVRKVSNERGLVMCVEAYSLDSDGTWRGMQEEKERLLKQMEESEEKIDRLQRGEALDDDAMQGDVAQANELTMALSKALKEQQLGLVGFSSLLADFFHKQQRHPMHLPIHLPKHPVDRRAILLACYDRKIAESRRFVAEKTRFLDFHKPHQCIEQFEADDGVWTSCLLDIDHISGRSTVRAVFDAVSSCTSNIELHASDKLGDITIREDNDETFSDDMAQRRIVSSMNGLDVETNLVLFRKYFPQGAAAADGFPNEHAVFAVQSVESDELYPFVPAERLRRDIVGSVVFSTVPSRQGHPDDRIVVSRCGYVTMRAGETGTPPAILQALNKGSMRWADMMLQSIREQLELQRFRR